MSIPIRRIVCPVDFSAPSTHAYRYARALADSLGAELHLMHAYTIPALPLPDGAVVLPAEMATAMSTRSQSALDAFIPDDPAERHLCEGPVPDAVAELVERLGADIVVLGTHGYGPIRRFLLGSVAERVIRSSTVPVLTIPPPEKE